MVFPSGDHAAKKASSPVDVLGTIRREAPAGDITRRPSELWKAIRSPIGDQCAKSPATGMVRITLPSSGTRRNVEAARYLEVAPDFLSAGRTIPSSSRPSDDHVGSSSCAGLLVRWMIPDPSAAIV